MKYLTYIHPGMVITLLACSLSTQAQNGTPLDVAEKTITPTTSQTDCNVQLNDAKNTLERALQLSALKRWNDALPSLREANAALMNTAANCPELANQAIVLGEKAVIETKQAEANASFQSDCQPRLDKALELDILASTARREKRDAKEQEQLLAAAETSWREAVNKCPSPHREKAERNLNVTVRTRATNAEQLNGGPACDIAWKNANTLGELAKSAWKDKQWEEAGVLYNTALLAWEGASEKCVGSRQQLAEKKIEQTLVDAHNAEYCGPQWDAATELTQHMKANAATAALAERDTQSIKAEVAWRDAVTLCRGTPKTLAKTNADALARERGAPLTPQAMAQHSKKPAVTSTPALAETSRPTKPESSMATTAAKASTELPKVEPTAAALAPAKLAADARTTSAQISTKPEESLVIVSGDVTYRGRFTKNLESGALSGEGAIEWSNGDRYLGQVLEGLRHGKGRFTWQTGQWYEGNWVNNIAVGQGVIQFSNGNRYTGTFSNGNPHGKGTMTFPWGDQYVGEFSQGSFHGQGSYIWSSGSRYDGAWVLGSKHGKGKLTMLNGSGWEGEFINDKETESGKRFSAPDKSANNSY